MIGSKTAHSPRMVFFAFIIVTMVALCGWVPVSAETDLGKAGPYATTIKSYNSYTIYSPQQLGANGETHPVITWGNGTGATPSMYSGLLRHLASYGFVVVCSNSTNTGTGKAMIAGIDLMNSENNSSSSAFYQKLNMNAVGACGHSQGGGGTINTAKDSRVKCSVPLMPAPAYTTGIQGPMFIIAGSADTILRPSLIKSYVFNRYKGTAVYGELQGASHMAPCGISPSTDILKYVTAWFKLYLMNETDLKGMFFGTGSTISQDAKWKVSVKESVTKIMEYHN